MIRIDAIWLATEPVDMRAGADTLLARVVKVFGAARPHHAYLFANRRATGMKVLVYDRWAALTRHLDAFLDRLRTAHYSEVSLRKKRKVLCAFSGWMKNRNIDLFDFDESVNLLAVLQAWLHRYEASSCVRQCETQSLTLTKVGIRECPVACGIALVPAGRRLCRPPRQHIRCPA